MDHADTEPGSLPTDAVLVRALARGDADAVARIDERSTRTSRRDFYRRRIEAALTDPGIRLSLAAEVGGVLAGFLIGSVDYGEFGALEPVAVLDAIGVDPDFRGRLVASALLRQLALNLGALRIERIRTEVDWRQHDLLAFLERKGFRPAPRLCLEAGIEGLERA